MLLTGVLPRRLKGRATCPHLLAAPIPRLFTMESSALALYNNFYYHHHQQPIKYPPALACPPFRTAALIDVIKYHLLTVDSCRDSTECQPHPKHCCLDCNKRSFVNSLMTSVQERAIFVALTDSWADTVTLLTVAHSCMRKSEIVKIMIFYEGISLYLKFIIIIIVNNNCIIGLT